MDNAFNLFIIRIVGPLIECLASFPSFLFT